MFCSWMHISMLNDKLYNVNECSSMEHNLPSLVAACVRGSLLVHIYLHTESNLIEFEANGRTIVNMSMAVLICLL